MKERRSHIENERFWTLSDASLQYIIQDAGEAIQANPTAHKATSGPGNWADQRDDAATVLGYRQRNGQSRSNGHIRFDARAEYFVRGENIYRAPRSNVIMPDGYRCGRFHTRQDYLKGV